MHQFLKSGRNNRRKEWEQKVRVRMIYGSGKCTEEFTWINVFLSAVSAQSQPSHWTHMNLKKHAHVNLWRLFSKTHQSGFSEKETKMLLCSAIFLNNCKLQTFSVYARKEHEIMNLIFNSLIREFAFILRLKNVSMFPWNNSYSQTRNKQTNINYFFNPWF